MPGLAAEQPQSGATRKVTGRCLLAEVIAERGVCGELRHNCPSTSGHLSTRSGLGRVNHCPNPRRHERVRALGNGAIEILAWHTTKATVSPLNARTTSAKPQTRRLRIPHPSRNYRIRVLLDAGGANWDLLPTLTPGNIRRASHVRSTAKGQQPLSLHARIPPDQPP
jgi:hypothetical protein